MEPPPLTRPEVAANFAVTWDARVSTRNRTPADFSSRRDKHRMLEIRATGDALLVGRATLETDRLAMGLPDEGLRAKRVARGLAPYPIRVVVSNSGRIAPSLRIFQSAFSPILIFSTGEMPPETVAALKPNAHIYGASGPSVDLPEMLQTLARDWNVRRLICEGGPALFRSLLEADLVDEINLTFCPLVFGGEAPSLTGPAGEFLKTTRECRLEHFETIEGECFARYRVVREEEPNPIDPCGSAV